MSLVAARKTATNRSSAVGGCNSRRAWRVCAWFIFVLVVFGVYVVSPIAAYAHPHSNITHELGSINALYKNFERHGDKGNDAFRLTLVSDLNVLTLVPRGLSTLSVQAPTSFSVRCGLVPLGSSVDNITTRGLKWNLSNGALRFGGLVSTSNELVDEQVQVETPEPLLFTLDTRLN